MYPFLNEDQKDLLKLFKEFAENEVAPISKEYDLSGEFPMETFKKAAEIGLTILRIPEEYGGLGQSSMTEMIMLEELSKADAGAEAEDLRCAR